MTAGIPPPASAAVNAIEARFAVRFGGFALDVDLQLPGRGVTALFGRSGSGKTTLLRCIAGLHRAPGRLSVRGAVWQDERVFVPVHRRPLGYVFQEASLFAHLTVRSNLDFGLKRLPPAQRGSGHRDAVALLGIEHLLDRLPAGLSGGERQRVAIARALALQPQLLLMDEPLASLDLPRKLEILPYLERLRDELDIPMLYVSHSVDEVARLADHLVVLADGQVLAQGSLQATLARLDLVDAFADEAGAVVDARVVAHDEHDHLTRVEFPGGSLHLARRPEAVGRRLRLRIRASDVSLADQRAERSSILNLLPAQVVELAVGAPGQVLVRLDVAGTPLLARISSRSCRVLQIEPGRRVWAQIKGMAIVR